MTGEGDSWQSAGEGSPWRPEQSLTPLSRWESGCPPKVGAVRASGGKEPGHDW